MIDVSEIITNSAGGFGTETKKTILEFATFSLLVQFIHAHFMLKF